MKIRLPCSIQGLQPSLKLQFQYPTWLDVVQPPNLSSPPKPAPNPYPLPSPTPPLKAPPPSPYPYPLYRREPIMLHGDPCVLCRPYKAAHQVDGFLQAEERATGRETCRAAMVRGGLADSMHNSVQVSTQVHTSQARMQVSAPAALGVIP